MTADRDFLFWLQSRLINVYNENANTDFVQKLGMIAANTPPKIDTWTEPKGRFHLLGETSTVGPRWQVWDNELKRAIINGLADQVGASKLIHLLNRQDQFMKQMKEQGITIKVPEETPA